MPNQRLRRLSRHLLALCTFLVPLGILAWLGERELNRQALEAQTAVEREALQFLRSALQALEQQFGQQLPAVAAAARDEARQGTLAAATRRLREQGFGAVVDIVLLDHDGDLRAPSPTPRFPSLPFSFPVRTSDAGAVAIAELQLANECLVDAETTLERAILDLHDRSERSERSDSVRFANLEREAVLEYRLATVRWRLADETAAPDLSAELRQRAIAGWQKVRDIVDLRLAGRPQFDDAFVSGFLAELALAEARPTPELRIALLQAIAAGQWDPIHEDLQRTIAHRAVAGMTAETLRRTEVGEALLEIGIHNEAREFATVYRPYLHETVSRRLTGKPDAALGVDADLRLVVYTIENHSSLLVLVPAHGREGAEADAADGAGHDWLGIRLDLAKLLAGALERFLRGDDTFVLAIDLAGADAQNQSIVSAPAAPRDFEPPSLTSFGLLLRAYPADIEQFTSAADRAVQRTRLLALILFLVATVGALWLWRSVSRESELLQLKVDLVSRVSHELKTPLSLISLYGETIGMGRVRDAEQSARFGNIITREAGRLTTLIQRILDFSRQQAGTLVYEPGVVDLHATLHEIATAYAPHIEAKGGALTADLGDPTTPIEVLADRTALASAVINLLENALKYGVDEAGPGEVDDGEPAAADRGIRLELRTVGDRAVIGVLDRGRGIPPRETEAVFDSFYRASNAGEVRGAGLGLSLVRHFARAHGGDAVVEPRPGGGSHFRILLPMHRSKS